MLTNEELQSKTISFLRFPLIVGVVLIHSRFEKVIINGVDLMKGGDLTVYTNISYLFSSIFSAIAVPIFFFISGFLFFYKTTSFSGKTYCQKIRKRVRTLLVPYLFWNLFVILLFFLSQTFLPDLMSGNNKLICNYSLSDWFWAFWDRNMINLHTDVGLLKSPICYQFWFIRDLMVVILLSPFVYWGVKKLRQYAVVCLGILWLLGWWFDVVGFSITAFFFFSAGAYFSIHEKNFVEMMKPFLTVATILYILMAIVILCFKEEVWCIYLSNINILVGIILAVSLSAHFIESGKWRPNTFLSDSSFFVYAYHAMPLTYVSKLLFKVVQPHTNGTLLMLYVLCPTIIILIGLMLYYLMKKYLPLLTSVITGGR